MKFTESFGWGLEEQAHLADASAEIRAMHGCPVFAELAAEEVAPREMTVRGEREYSRLPLAVSVTGTLLADRTAAEEAVAFCIEQDGESVFRFTARLAQPHHSRPATCDCAMWASASRWAGRTRPTCAARR